MQNSVKKIHEAAQQGSDIIDEVIDIAKENLSQEVTKNVVDFVTRSKLIAQQSEEACQLTDTPDFDDFEEKYGISSFV